MQQAFSTLLRILNGGFKRECGQNLVEYAFIVALIGLGIVAGMRAAAFEVENVFLQLATVLSTALAHGPMGNGG